MKYVRLRSAYHLRQLGGEWPVVPNSCIGATCKPQQAPKLRAFYTCLQSRSSAASVLNGPTTVGYPLV